MRKHFTSTKMAIKKKKGKPSIGEDVEKQEPFYTADGNVKCASHCAN